SSLNNSLMLGTLSGLYFRPATHVNNVEGELFTRAARSADSLALRALSTDMAQTQAPARGGMFLTSTVSPGAVFVQEDLSDEQRLFGQTASEFMHKEVLPVVERLYHHDWALTRELLKKASDLDLLRLEIPPAYGGLGLDLISASYVGEQIAINPSFGGSLGA